MAKIFVAYNMQDNSKVSKGFIDYNGANDFANSQDDSDDWDVCCISHLSMSQEEMIQAHELIISNTDNMLPN